MDYIFWTKAILLTLLLLELIPRALAPFFKPGSTPSTMEMINPGFLIRLVLFTIVITKLEEISTWIAARLPEKGVDYALNYPIWLIPICIYCVILLANQQSQKKIKY